MASYQVPFGTKRQPLKNVKVVPKEETPRRVTPSVYTQEILQSTKERLDNTSEVHPPPILELLDTNKTTHHKFPSVDIGQPLFQPYPSELVFQNFTPAETYKIKLHLLNNDKVPRQVKLELQHSKYFRVDCPKDATSKVASGMFVVFTVCFTPMENKDYHHRLVFATERERFEVPIRAIGPRAILDFCDQFHLPVCAVKSSTERTHLVRNTGNNKAKFTLRTQRPFSVTPSSGTLDVGEWMQVTVDFNPMTTGDHSQDLILHYDTGEDVYISLYGTCKKLNVHLEPDSVPLWETYISQATVYTVSLTNRTDVPLKYYWTPWPSLQEEALNLLNSESSVLQQMEEEERQQLLFQCESDPTEIHCLPLLSRALQEHRCQAVQDLRLALSHSCITVEPPEGEIYPKVTAQFVIVFKPEEAKLYQQTIYCDVTGCESRLPLTLKGKGNGPKLQLSCNLVNIKNVFIGDKNSYKVKLFNIGLIDAPFRLSSLDTTFGRCFSISPEEGVVPPGACQSVQVTFQSHILGTFSEHLMLTVTGQPEPPTLTFSGCVIGPTFEFSALELDFGDVGFGFPREMLCSLVNTSYVPMTYTLRVLGDGLGSPSVTWKEQLSDVSMDSWQVSAARELHAQPAEFTISPAEGIVPYLSEVTFKVTLCANTVRTFNVELVADVQGAGEEIMALPIKARCVVPNIIVEPPVLEFQECFLNLRYEQKVRLINESDVPACYGVLDQEYEGSPSLRVGSSLPRGVMGPHSSKEIPVFLMAKAIGPLHHALCIAVFGSIQLPLEVALSCIGLGPIVHVQSQQLDFDRLQVLTDSARSLHLSNQSPIPARFTASMSCRRSCWRIEPSEGEVPPNSQLELRVVAHLKDTLHFKDELKVSIQHSQICTVPLSATGTGTTIVSDRPFGPSLDLGTHFSSGSCQYHFKLTNHGQQTQRLFWQTDGSMTSTPIHKRRNSSGHTVLPPISSSKKKDILGYRSVLPSRRQKSVFNVSPASLTLLPGCSSDMVLMGLSDSPKVVQEHLKCRSIVGNENSFQDIMSVDVTCRFVAPVLSISSKQLNFYIKKVPGKSLMPQYEKLTLMNVSSLSLSMELSVVEPFSLCEAPEAHSSATTKSMVLSNKRQAELWVCFNPSYCLDQVSQVVDEFLEVHYQGHPQQDTVKLHAEVHFPNLHFSSTTVDFGCMFNYTKSHRQIWMTNCSSLPVNYSWTFLDDQQHSAISPRPGAAEQSNTQRTIQVFDILPNCGHLQPGNKQQVTFCFYGQENVCREVVAQCHVQEGPTYIIKLRGEVSVISYSIDSTHIDFGLQLFDHEGEAELTLRNTGKVGFKFSITDPQTENEADEQGMGQRRALEEAKQESDLLQQKDCEENEKKQEIRPGRPMVIPSMGYINAGAKQRLHVLYLPGIPEVFEKRIQLKVAFLPPQDITLTGAGVFPSISLNLPQNLADKCYSAVVQRARTAVEADGVQEVLMNEISTSRSETTEACTLTYEELLRMEIEKMLVKENALAVAGRLLELRNSQDCSTKWLKRCKFHSLGFLLPEYVLDFGYVIPSQMPSHTVNVTNTGSVAVSFHANLKPLAGTGFSAEIERVKNLPCGETQTFRVKFDPQKSNMKMGERSVVMPIQVTCGPVVQVRLCAVLTVPAITVSTDTLQFDTVQCGMCQMKAIQLFNHQSVPCSWTIAEKVKPFKKVDKFMPLHLRKKVLQQQRPPPVVFEMIPCSGMLSPGERVNVLIKFSPAEGHTYSRQLVVCVAESTQQVFLTACGQGEEPQLQFTPPVLELAHCLPVSTEVEAEVIIKNPCSFPIEFYSLEFDTQYLEEEKILRLMHGYDESNKLLLPPRNPGENLPYELLDYYKEYCSQLKNDELKTDVDEQEVGMGDTHEDDRRSRDRSASRSSTEEEIHNISEKPTELLISELTKEGSSCKLGQLETSPVSRAIARHMCVDLSLEGVAARNRRGISIIVYGAPLTGKSSTAAALACHYGGACLSVDAVITEVLINGTSPVGLTARQLYDCAAAQYAERKAREAAQAVEGATVPGLPTDLEASAPASLDTVDIFGKPSDDCWLPQETEKTHLSLCLGGDVTTLSNLMPEKLLVDILAERFQQNDCHRGVMIGGLESVYTQSAAQTLQVVLKALANRKHIYVVNLSDSYTALKSRERALRETEVALQQEKADRKKQWLQELDEEEYDALPEEKKERIIQRHRETLKQKKLRELERTVKNKEEKKHQEGEKKDTKEVSTKKRFLEGKQSTDALRMLSPYNKSKECLVDTKEQHNLNEVHHSKEAEDLPKKLKTTKASYSESLQSTDKLKREKTIENAEMKKEKELKKSKMERESDDKDVSGKKGLPDGKEILLLQSPVMLDDHQMFPCDTSKESRLDKREQHHLNEAHKSKEDDQSQNKTDEAKGLQAECLQPEDKLERDMPIVDELQTQFTAYERSQEQVQHILQHWDRAQGFLLVPLSSEEASAVTENTVKQNPVGKRSQKGNSKAMSPILSQREASVEAKVSPQDTIPHIVLNVTGKDYPSAIELLKGNTLPPLDEVLDDMGLGPSGPPIPPPTTFSMVSFPKNRQESVSSLTCDHFTFLVPSRLYEQDEEENDSEENIQEPVVKEKAATLSKSRSKGSIKESTVIKEQKSQRRKRQTLLRVSSTSDCTETTQEDQNQAPLELKRKQRLTTFRWVVPANGEVVLRIWFYSDCPGKFEQTFNFELLGTQRHYQLFCRGICTYPSICKDHMTLFALSKKVPEMQEGIQKTYVTKPGYFEFGPLLCGKSRDRYKENRYPENTERLVIHNDSGLEAEVQFRFQHDTQATTYLLDPPAMTLKPDQKQELTVWAYPTELGPIKDSVVCYIKDNPELVIINLSCWGVRPELKLESKHLHFGKILVHRRDSRSVMLHNKTPLPVSWRVQGMEELGDEFSVPQDQGIISSNCSFPLRVHFRARRPLHIKKILRFEISDVDKILGIVHTENIQVTAEAYDIALDISPADDCLDFGTIRVFEESKLSFRMKNLGKYDIAYKFTFQQMEPTQANLDSIFTVSHQSGTLMPHKKSTIVEILCKPITEVLIREQPVLSCQVIEPNMGNGGETIAILPIKVSVKAVFSRYKITPAHSINFGPLVYGSKESQSFTIENNGVFETHYTICHMITDHAPPGKPGGSGKKKGIVRNDSFQISMKNMPNTLTMEVFSVFPCTGSLQPGSQQVVTVNCVAKQLGNWNHSLFIDISDRDPSDQPDGIPYRLLVEVCQPRIVLDMASIFEEYHLCHYSSQLSSEQFCNAEGIYVQEENQFIFNKVLVGQTAQARFKITNNSKVPCMLSLAIKHVDAKTTRNMEAFDLSSTTLSIPSQSHSFAVVTFTPQMMQLYRAVFEATMEGSTRSRMSPDCKRRLLGFKLMGEGSLPSVCVVRPAVRNSRGSPMLQFRRVLVGHRHILPLVLLNDGSVPAQVQVDMLDKYGVFTLRAAPGNTCSSIHSTELEGTTDSELKLVHRATLRLNVNEPVEFEVIFHSDKPLSVKAKMSLQVKDNQYGNTIIQVAGEAYQEIVSLNNIRRSLQDIDGDDNEGGNYDVLNFGECPVDCPSQESFTMTNHSSSQVVRFEWPPAGPHVCFSPQVGHLHAGCSKEVTVTFCSSQPVCLTSQPMRCKLCQVVFQQPLEQVADWDDRRRTVQWQSSSKQASASPQQHVKNKVIMTLPEPCCSVVEGSLWEVELRISAVCDYVKFSCNTDTIHFKDTMLYQTRLHHLQIMNHGNVKLEFSFQVNMAPSNSIGNHDQGEETRASRPWSRSAGGLTGARPTSAMGCIMSLLIGNPELPPLSIEPSIGAIEPGAMQNFNIRFSPLQVAQFEGRLVCSIPNLQDGDQAPCISVHGRSLLPHCHFDLEDSDYINGIGRNPKFTGTLDPNTRVIEFKTVGLSSPSTRRFSVVNPTNKPYSFKWSCKDTGDSPFCCLTPCGTILPGEKVEVCFEYVAKRTDAVESFWSFVIETLSLSVPFVCVGTTREPRVYLNRPHLDFGELLAGRKVEKTIELVNGEEEPFYFSVKQSSLLCDDQQSTLILQPMTGTVAPKDRLPLSVSFTPCREGYVSFKLVLRVKKKSEPLALTVKADCFTMSTSLQVAMSGRGFREVNPDHQNTLDFGKVEISERSIINFVLTNLARFTLEVKFDLNGPSKLLQCLEVKPQNATTEVGRQLQSSLVFCPQSICNLQDIILSIKVKFGATFTFAMKGRAVEPSLGFSFTKYNFGKCFLYCPGMVPASQTLVISNKGEKDISVQCQFKNTAYLEMDFQPDILSPGAVIEVPVKFCPREVRHYHEKLTFISNSSVTKQVDILGQGIEMKLEVEDPRQKKLKLESLLGQKVKKQVVLVNRSPLDVSFTLLLNTSIQLDPRDLSFSPAGELRLKASGGSCNVEIHFSPRQRMPPFTAELHAVSAGLLCPLLTIQGICQGVEVQLDQDHLSLGAVVQHCQAKKRIVMINTGDVGARFQWKTDNFPPELSITPVKGFISPGKEVPFQVTFAPMEQSNDTRYEDLSCCVEGSSSPVTLTVTGSCIIASTNKEVVNFVCPVRGSHTQTLHVSNPTSQHCSIIPVIHGEQWSAASPVILKPLENKIYKITYRPLTMTAAGKKHLGSVFFSFPDGTGLLYSLQGTAEPPEAEDTIVHQLPAKTHHTQLLPVHNWLSEQQRFNVLIEILKPDEPDATVSLKGLQYFEVPALTKRDYDISFSAYREGQYNAKVTFRNVLSNEYFFYLMTFKVTPPEVLSAIKLVATVRQAVMGTVLVENPLTTDTCLTIECKCPEISAPPHHTVLGQSKGFLSLKYQPLRAGTSTARLTLCNNDLGYFHYDLLLSALPPPPEKTVQFSTCLGSSQSELVKFINYSHMKTVYSCKTDCTDFSVDKNVGASPGSQAGIEATVLVCFEPHQVGEVRSQLSLSSEIGGEYIFPLHGNCLPPKAQGPFSIRTDHSITIPFKNVFLQTTAFSFQVDNPCFTVKGVNLIPSKKIQDILISFEAPPGGSAGSCYGKLIISNQPSEGQNKPCSWVYYLKGYRHDSC